MVAPIRVNWARSILHRAGGRALADDQVELEVLHRRIEDLLDRRIEAVDLVDEQDVALLEIGQERGEVAGLGDHRAGGGAEVDAELARDDLGERGLAEAGRAGEQDMVERLAARARGVDEDLEVGARLGLADEVAQTLRTQLPLGFVLAAAAADRPAGSWRRELAEAEADQLLGCRVRARRLQRTADRRTGLGLAIAEIDQRRDGIGGGARRRRRDRARDVASAGSAS